MLDSKTQERLADKGFYTGAIDGRFGPLSYAALIAYAAARPIDGGLSQRGELATTAYREYGLAADPYQLAEFLAQLVIESRGFTATREDLRYSALALLRTWGPGHGGRIKDMADAKKLEYKPQLIANRVYARASMENTGPNDGWLFRGAFDIQLTGKRNWRIFGERLKIDLIGQPEKYSKDVRVCHLVALEYWKMNNVMTAVKDRDFLGARKIVNMGSRRAEGTPHGLEAVRIARERILKILGV